MTPSAALLEGRRYVDGFTKVQLLQDLSWFKELKSWALKCRLKIDSASPHTVPNETDWWVTLENKYPFGKISFWPANENGLVHTFPHQSFNQNTDGTLPWRTGEICIRSPSFVFGKTSLDPDPIGNAKRLGWYFNRALEWLEAAANGNLLAYNDPYELPEFPRATSLKYYVAHGETTDSFSHWKATKTQYGIADLVAVDSPRNKFFVVNQFLDEFGSSVCKYSWGRMILESNCHVIPAAWIRCNDVPMNVPYQGMNEWKDLINHLGEDLFRKAINLIRDGESHLLLVGFPIPIKAGNPPKQIHWQPILLPKLAHGTKFRNGFRPGEYGYWMHDKFSLFSSSAQADWHKAENWSYESSTGRGCMKELKNCSPTIIGGGAVGAVVAELLVRGGSDSVLICDGDRLEHGNLCRHTLAMSDVGQNKADALAEKLNGVHAHAKVQSISENFPPLKQTNLDLIKGSEVIIDCTAEDTVMHEMANFPWGPSKFFCSISISYKAKRIYIYMARGTRFTFEDFQNKFSVWAEHDSNEFAGEKLVQSEAGCWHPTFPARIDEVWMLSSAAVRVLEESINFDMKESKLIVFEQNIDRDGFSGIQRVYQ